MQILEKDIEEKALQIKTPNKTICIVNENLTGNEKRKLLREFEE